MKPGIAIILCGIAAAQEPVHQHNPAPPTIPLQPLAQQVRQLEEALNYLGQPLPPSDHQRINTAIANPDQTAAVTQLESVLDQYALVTVDINPESRVKVEQGSAKPVLAEGGTRLFLVKVVNNGHVTAPLNVESPNSGNVYIESTGSPAPPIKLTPLEAADRWADISLYQRPPLKKRLSGLALEYAILEVYSRDAGQRSAKISFNVGQGSQDIGFRNDVLILFTALPARNLTLRVKDENGKPAMASFIIRDRLRRLYPNPAKRLAPDLFFQPQIYRADGETVQLPAGYYTVEYTGGPEYRTHSREFAMDTSGPDEVSFQLDRWIDPSKYGWYSGDHHVHAAGCSHYMNPAEGVDPQPTQRRKAAWQNQRGSPVPRGSSIPWPDPMCPRQRPRTEECRILTAYPRAALYPQTAGLPLARHSSSRANTQPQGSIAPASGSHPVSSRKTPSPARRLRPRPARRLWN
jgi:hypothetical protein